MLTVRRTLVVLAAAWASAAMTNTASAQVLRARSDAFTGCWRAIPGFADSRTSVNSGAPVVCVLPIGDGLEFNTVTDGKVVSRSQIDATGRDADFTASGCRGTQSARWSTDGRRLYTHSAAICSGGLQRITSGLFALTPSGEWIDIQSLSAGEGSSVRVMRYRDAGATRGLPAEIMSALGDRGYAMQAARLAAGSAVTTADVLETSNAVTPAVAEAWLLERHQQFGLDAAKVAVLADAGMPERLIDAMVASSYPGTFTVAHIDVADGQSSAIELVPDTVYTRERYASFNPWAFSPYGYAGYYGSPYGPLGYDAGFYGLNDYAYGYGGYGYMGYGSPFYSNYGGSGYRPPVIILYGNIVAGAGGATAHAVKGRGYTRDTSPAPSSTGSRSPSSQPSSTSSGSSSAAQGSSSNGGSSGRSAKPRSP